MPKERHFISLNIVGETEEVVCLLPQAFGRIKKMFNAYRKTVQFNAVFHSVCPLLIDLVLKL